MMPGRWLPVVLAACLSRALVAQGAAATTAFEVPAWAFPAVPAAGPLRPDPTALFTVPGSTISYPRSRVLDVFDPPDWFPDSHPPMPRVVSQGRRPAVMACGFCHLPDGRGRPENASLSGLPAAYIVAQVHEMQSRARQTAAPVPYRPAMLMTVTADAVSDEELAEAAAYFAALPLAPRNRVVEAETIPSPIAVVGLYRAGPGTEPLGERLIEMPDDMERHELRDPTVGYVTYVPPGSLARGAAIARSGAAGPMSACTTCHGPALRGMAPAPPLAGRSPSALLRQLLAFRTGARASAAAAPMRMVTAELSLAEMIAVAAYAGSLEP